MTMGMKKRIGTVLAYVTFFSGTMAAMAAGDNLLIPEDFGKWPVVALLTFICVVSLIINYCLVKSLFQMIDKNREVESQRITSVANLTASITAQAEKMGEQNTLYRELAGKQSDMIKVFASKPCGFETPAFREFLREKFIDK